MSHKVLRNVCGKRELKSVPKLVQKILKCPYSFFMKGIFHEFCKAPPGLLHLGVNL